MPTIFSSLRFLDGAKQLAGPAGTRQVTVKPPHGPVAKVRRGG
jgi:hypothetical protein